MSTEKLRELWRKANAKYRSTEKGRITSRRSSTKKRQSPTYKVAAVQRTKVWMQNNPDKVKAQRFRAVLKMHNLTPEKYHTALAEQNNVCALCTGSFTETNGPTIDHDHRCCDKGSRSCGKCFCGIIHNKCNRGIGQLDDEPEKTRLAYEYLLRTR